MWTNKLHIKSLVILLTLGLALAGCNSEHYDYYGEAYSETDYIVYSIDDTPFIDSFSITDAYGENTILDNPGRFRLNPFIDDGHFEVFWEVFAADDYTFTIRVNDTPTVFGSRLIQSSYCGFDLDCDDTGMQYCRVDPEDRLSCSDRFDQIGSNNVYIGDFIDDHPDTLYMIVEACDVFVDECEFDVQALVLE